MDFCIEEYLSILFDSCTLTFHCFPCMSRRRPLPHTPNKTYTSTIYLTLAPTKQYFVFFQYIQIFPTSVATFFMYHNTHIRSHTQDILYPFRHISCLVLQSNFFFLPIIKFLFQFLIHTSTFPKKTNIRPTHQHNPP